MEARAAAGRRRLRRDGRAHHHRPDLARYVAFLLSAWPPRDDPDTGPVRRSSLREMQQNGRFDGLSATRATPEGPLRVTAGTYGFGLGVRAGLRTPDRRPQRRAARLRVDHAPAARSRRRRLRDGQSHLRARGRMARQAMEILRRRGRWCRVSCRLADARRRARRASPHLLARWDDAAARALAADNFFLDRPLECAATRWRGSASGTAAAGRASVEPENWLRGRFRAECERGWVDVSFTLAPTRPPRLQWLEPPGSSPSPRP